MVEKIIETAVEQAAQTDELLTVTALARLHGLSFTSQAPRQYGVLRTPKSSPLSGALA
jgi:hypothetical protein